MLSHEHAPRVDIALSLARKGYHVAPVTVRRNPATGRKMPTYHGQWALISTTDVEQIREWADTLGPNVGFAVDCAKSGLVVVDLDVKPGLDAPSWWSTAGLPVAPYRVETPSGGLHLYWRAHDSKRVANSQGKLAPGVDVRGVGGHVFAPGTHIVGEPDSAWRALDDIPPVADLPSLPDEVYRAIPTGSREPRTERAEWAYGATHERWWVQEQAETQRARVAEHLPEEGTGFRAVLRGAALVHGRAVAAGLLDRDEAERLLREAVEECWGLANDEDERWIDTGLDDGEADPWTVLETGDKPTPDAAGADEDAEPVGRRLRVVKASEIAPKIAHWLWQTDDGFGRIPLGEVTVYAGRGNVGKSPAALWKAARLTRGELRGEHFGTPRNVVIYASEDSHAHTTVPRLMAAGADLDRVYLVVGTASDDDPEMPLDWSRDVKLIRAKVEETDAVLLIIDPLVDVHRSGSDTNKVDDVRTGLRPIVALAHATGAAVIGIAHFNKQRSGDVATLLSGSHGLRDVVRAVIAFVQRPDGERVLGQDKNNLGRSGDDVPRLTYTMASVEVVIDGVSTSQPVFEITGTTDDTLEEVLLGTGEPRHGVPEDIFWVLQAVASTHPEPYETKLLRLEAKERGELWDGVQRRVKRSGLLRTFQQSGAAAQWVYALTEQGAREAGKPWAGEE